MSCNAMNEKQTITLYLQGMTCTLCAKRVEEALKEQPGVFAARVDFAGRKAEVFFEPAKVTPQKLCEAVEAAGYGASSALPGRALGKLAATLATLWGLYFVMERFGLLNALVPSQLADDSMGYGMLFVTGLLTSVHCVAMCGGIGLSQSLAGVKKTSLAPMLHYQLGRVISYVSLGAILGALGGLLGSIGGLSYGFQGALKLLAGAAMLIMGLNMLAILPGLPKLPGLKVKFRRPKGLSPFCIGLLNGFMPCGPLQSMLLLALASGSALRGGLSMLCFSLGTLPLLLGFGSLAAWLGKKFTGAVLSCGAVLIAVFGLSMLSQGGSLTGLFTPTALLLAAGWMCIALFLRKLPLRTWQKAGAAGALLVLLAWVPRLLPEQENVDVARMEGDVQVVESQLLAWDYADIRVAAGVPVRWVIHADADEINGCNNQILCHAFSIDLTFRPGENVVEFTPTAPGTYPYSCWMGMIHGTIYVE